MSHPDILGTLYSLCQMIVAEMERQPSNGKSPSVAADDVYARLCASMYTGATTPPDRMDVMSVLTTMDIARDEGREVAEDVALWISRQSAQREVPPNTKLL